MQRDESLMAQMALVACCGVSIACTEVTLRVLLAA